jgi:hypothetical protein
VRYQNKYSTEIGEGKTERKDRKERGDEES